MTKQAIKDIVCPVTNTDKAKARRWKELMESGYTLLFSACNGAVLTAGPYQCATETTPGGFALLGVKGQHIVGDASWVGREIVRYCGRVLPNHIYGKGI